MASAVPANMPGIVRDSESGMRFTDWNCRAGQSDVIIRTDGTVAPCFPMYSSSFDWGNIDTPKFDAQQLQQVKGTCQRHCFSTLNRNLGYCYNDARVIKWLWRQVVPTVYRGRAVLKIEGHGVPAASTGGARSVRNVFPPRTLRFRFLNRKNPHPQSSRRTAAVFAEDKIPDKARSNGRSSRPCRFV